MDKLAAAGVPYVLAYNRHPLHPCVSADSEGAVRELVGLVSGQPAASDRAQHRWRTCFAKAHRVRHRVRRLDFPLLFYFFNPQFL